jgi:regulator of ribonuclease activity A
VVDGGGSLRCALIGDKLAAMAYKNGWAGIIVYGCVRDTVRLAQVPIGIKAIGSNPMRSFKTGAGSRNKVLSFGGTTFMPNSYLYADEDGVIVSDRRLL